MGNWLIHYFFKEMRLCIEIIEVILVVVFHINFIMSDFQFSGFLLDIILSLRVMIYRVCQSRILLEILWGVVAMVPS